MTVYNREKYIAKAIESVLASTYRNWELIIVDDQSNDNSCSIAMSYAQKDTRIKVYINNENLGDYPNRNQAASYAKGKYLKYVDSDDLIYPFGLEQLVFYMEQFPMAGYGLCSLDQDDKRIFPFQLSPLETYRRHYIHKISVFHKAPLSSIIVRDVFLQEGGFSSVRHYGDSELWHRLSKKYKVVLMPGGLVWSRVTDGQEAAIRSNNPANALKTFQSAKRHIKSENCPLLGKEKEVVLKLYNQRIASVVLSAFKRHGWKKGMEMQGMSDMNLVEVIRNRFF
ncbi:glycosyltransferase family 2 protein [Flavobacteriaceae bacterium F89]|uniref:Glycosyltransferase family 2 protein n=1 Tax=Cerina litoralis TaxID=2874477 RepID=A0AAE3EYN4_9FLAO|nr:glycosyltransferase family A protein [Cerina litoralis]MCG2462594.1 glycosyltransferase family 2 protein [Cerina litoralis]